MTAAMLSAAELAAIGERAQGLLEWHDAPSVIGRVAMAEDLATVARLIHAQAPDVPALRGHVAALEERNDRLCHEADEHDRRMAEARHGIETQAATIRGLEAQRVELRHELDGAEDTIQAHADMMADMEAQRDAAVRLAKAERAYRVRGAQLREARDRGVAIEIDVAIVNLGTARAALIAAGGEP